MVAATTPVVTSTGPKPLATAPAGTTTPFIAQKTIVLPRQQHTLRRKNKNRQFLVNTSWHWPTKGRIVEGFSVAEQGNKGIDISGQKGQPFTLRAAAKWSMRALHCEVMAS